jgi:hypothetical protein
MITPLPHTGDVVEGVVSKANERGVLLTGEDAWINVSKFAQPAPKLPRRGEHVRLHLDRYGFIRDVEALRDEERARYAVVPSEDGVDAPTPEEPSRQVERAENRPLATNSPDRELRITRMACLNTATAILSSGGRAADPEAVLALATRLEAWVCR